MPPILFEPPAQGVSYRTDGKTDALTLGPKKDDISQSAATSASAVISATGVPTTADRKETQHQADNKRDINMPTRGFDTLTEPQPRLPSAVVDGRPAWTRVKEFRKLLCSCRGGAINQMPREISLNFFFGDTFFYDLFALL